MMKYVLPLLIAALSIDCSQSSDKSETEKRRYPERSFSTIADVLENAKESAEAIPGLHSLLVYRQGELVLEEYLHRYSGKRPEHIRSCTKSIMSLLMGIAIDQGIIESTNEPISTYFPDLAATPKGKVTIENLLSMSSGFEWSEGADNSEFNEWRTSSRHIDYVLSKKLESQPGEKFNYSTGSFHLLSVILTKSSGVSTFEFAKKHLFDPLEITHVTWEFISGYYNGGAGLELLPRDMVKIGRLVLNNGTYNGRQIISKEWITRSVKSHHTLFEDNGEHQGYGYGWWTYAYKGERFYGAQGFAGQNILVAPPLELIVVTTAQWTNLRGKAVRQSGKIFKLVSEDVALPIFLNGL